MLSIITNKFGPKPNGQPRQIDLHSLRLGKKPATSLYSQELYEELVKLGVPDVKITIAGFDGRSLQF
jgi:hypothetical protein